MGAMVEVAEPAVILAKLVAVQVERTEPASCWHWVVSLRKRRSSISDPWDRNYRRFDFARAWANGPAVRRARFSDPEGSRGAAVLEGGNAAGFIGAAFQSDGAFAPVGALSPAAPSNQRTSTPSRTTAP
jgi:hypothetical protein